MNLEQTLAGIDWTVIDELHHIPRGPQASLQEAFRIEYATYRAIHSDLHAQLTPRDALVQAVFNLRRTHPEFTPNFDRAFFFEGSRMGSTLAGDPLIDEIHAMAAAGGDCGRIFEHANSGVAAVESPV